VFAAFSPIEIAAKMVMCIPGCGIVFGVAMCVMTAANEENEVRLEKQSVL
jgi:hypothetical protein